MDVDIDVAKTIEVRDERKMLSVRPRAKVIVRAKINGKTVVYRDILEGNRNSLYTVEDGEYVLNDEIKNETKKLEEKISTSIEFGKRQLSRLQKLTEGWEIEFGDC